MNHDGCGLATLDLRRYRTRPIRLSANTPIRSGSRNAWDPGRYNNAGPATWAAAKHSGNPHRLLAGRDAPSPSGIGKGRTGPDDGNHGMTGRDDFAAEGSPGPSETYRCMSRLSLPRNS